MLKRKPDEPTLQRPLRLWPGVVAVVLQWLLMYVVPLVAPDASMFGMLGGIGLGLVVVVWWLFFSRAPWVDRVGAIVLMVIAVIATKRVVHESIAGAGMGMLLYFYSIPVLSLALVAAAVVSRRLSSGPRRAVMTAAILLACGAFTLIRTGGISGEGDSDFHWRWTETPEERLLVQASSEPVASPPAPATAEIPEKLPEAQSGEAPATLPAASVATKPPEKPLVAKAANEPPAPAVEKTVADWPGFRGPGRDGVVRSMQIKTDWAASPPVEMWRRPIGPGWSSFAVRGDRFYTQEQRGEEEVVACYNVITGEPIWMHSDSARFWESNGGAGPRGTPTLSNGRVYTFGGTGILNALNAGNGAVVWSRNAASDTKAKLPYWGFASSPLVINDLVIVATSGALIAYDLATGEPRWSRPDSSASYSSPHLVIIDSVAQILTLSANGLSSVAPSDGTVLWQHPWPGYPIVQPALTADGDVLISVSDKSGVRRLAVTHGAEGWTVAERWTSSGLKPYFNDFVVHKGHAFGFDGSILACIDLQDGKRKWKGGRYGHGQFVLLSEQDLLLVVSERGELALVNAAPDKFTELAKVPAIKSKTWNHPVLAGDVLLVRNGQEMAAFRLSRAGK